MAGRNISYNTSLTYPIPFSMESLETWEKLLLGALALLLIFVLRPGLREAFRQSKEAKERDWAGLLVPLIMVVLFVVLLIMMV